MSHEIVPSPRLGDLSIADYVRLVSEGLLFDGTPETAFGVSLYLERVARSCDGSYIGEVVEALASGIIEAPALTPGARHDPLLTVATRLGLRRGPCRGDAEAAYETLERTLALPLDTAQRALVRPR